MATNVHPRRPSIQDSLASESTTPARLLSRINQELAISLSGFRLATSARRADIHAPFELDALRAVAAAAATVRTEVEPVRIVRGFQSDGFRRRQSDDKLIRGSHARSIHPRFKARGAHFGALVLVHCQECETNFALTPSAGRVPLESRCDRRQAR